MAKKPASERTASGDRSASRSTSRSALDASRRVVVLHGEDAFLRQLYTTQLREALESTFGTVDVVTLDGSAAPAADVLDECRSFGLLATHKLVIVDNADQLVKEDNRPLFERYAQGLIDSGDPASAGATLVLRSSTWRPGKLDKLVEQVGTLVKCDAPTPEKAAEWAVVRAKKEHRAELSRESAERLVSRVGPELGRLDVEIAKLAAAAGEGRPITPALIAEFVGHSREEEVWAIQSELIASSPERALRAVRQALDISRHPPVLVFFAMTDLARKLHAASWAVRGGANFWQARGSLKLWGPGGEAIFQAAAGLSPAAGRTMLGSCLESTLRDRTGVGESERTLERLALGFAGLSPRRGRG